jgi:ankyrin repeat protein
VPRRGAADGHVAKNADGACDVLKLLLNARGIEVNARDCNGRTPLMWASQRGSVAAVAALVNDVRVDVAAVDSDGVSAEAWATQEGHTAAQQQLRDAALRRDAKVL